MLDRPIRVLLIEDNPVEARLIQAILARAKGATVELECADYLGKGLERLSAGSFDAVLLDLSLPDSEGLETFRRVYRQAPDVPVVVLTVSDDEALATRALQEGAQDYLFKGQADANLLIRSVRYAIERHRLRSQLERQTERLSRHLQLLRQGFSRLSGGDMNFRIADQMAETDGRDELTGLLRGFDRTVEKLRDLSDLKAQFFSMVTHDLRAPLGTIMLTANALEGIQNNEQERAAFLEIIKRKASHVIGLVEELLEVFFIQSGQLKLLPYETDLNEMLHTCVHDLTRQAAARGMKLQLEPMAGDASLYCDPTKIYRVLENLISNAIKYSVEGDSIEVRACAIGDDRVRIEVADHGPGIEPEDRKKLFEPFYRGNKSQSRIKGSGLGLGICKAFVEAHGGRIWVDSEPGIGTRFCFELPRRVPAEDEQKPADIKALRRVG